MNAGTAAALLSGCIAAHVEQNPFWRLSEIFPEMN